MKTLTTPKGMVPVVLCYAAIIIFSSFLVETAYAHSTGSVVIAVITTNMEE